MTLHTVKAYLFGGPGPTRQIRFFASFIQLQVTTPDRLEDPPQAFTEEMHQWVQPWGSKLQANSTRASQYDCLEQHSSSNTHEWFTNLHNSGCSRPAVAAAQRHCLQDKSRLFSKTRLENNSALNQGCSARQGWKNNSALHTFLVDCIPQTAPPETSFGW